MDGVGGPWGRPVTLGDHTVFIQGITKSGPWPIESWSGMNGDVSVDTIRVVCVPDTDNAGVVNVQVRPMCLSKWFRVRVSMVIGMRVGMRVRVVVGMGRRVGRRVPSLLNARTVRKGEERERRQQL